MLVRKSSALCESIKHIIHQPLCRIMSHTVKCSRSIISTDTDTFEKRKHDDEENSEDKADTKRVKVWDCRCLCVHNELTDSTNETEPNFRCECTRCGPLKSDGNRRCMSQLSAMQLSVITATGGRVVCTDCRNMQDWMLLSAIVRDIMGGPEVI